MMLQVTLKSLTKQVYFCSWINGMHKFFQIGETDSAFDMNDAGDSVGDAFKR